VSDLLFINSRNLKTNKLFSVFLLAIKLNSDNLFLVARNNIARNAGERNITPNMETQEFKIDLTWLYDRGWTLNEAAFALDVNPGHLSRVLNGDRESRRLVNRVKALPKKKLQFRRNLKNSK